MPKYNLKAGYSAYIHGFKSIYNFFNRTLPTVKNHMKMPEDVLRNHFILAITCKSSILERLRQTLVPPIPLDGIVVTTPHLKTGRTQYIKVVYWRYCGSHCQPKHEI